VRRACVSLALAACGAASHPGASAPPALADLGWLVGAWRADGLDVRWQLVETTLWGVALRDGGFEVNYVDDSDDAGKPAPIALVGLDGAAETHFALRRAAAAEEVFGSATDGELRLARGEAGLRGAYAPPGQPAVAFTAAAVAPQPAPDAEDADRQFAADSAREGAEAWARWFAADGELWSQPPIRGTEAIRAARAKSPAQLTLATSRSPSAGGRLPAARFTAATARSGGARRPAGARCSTPAVSPTRADRPARYMQASHSPRIWTSTRFWRIARGARARVTT
jgi:hypothetical protein